MSKLLLIGVLLMGRLPAEIHYTVGVLGRQENLEKLFAEAGYAVEHISFSDFIDSERSAERFDCIVFTHSVRFPYAAAAALNRYLRKGGDVVTLRGHCFSEPVYRVEDGWLDAQEYLDAALNDGQHLHPGLDMETLDLRQWARDADNTRNPSVLSLKDSPFGRRLCVEIRNFSRWDTFRGPFTGRTGHNAVLLGLQGDGTLNDIVVEIRERDGSRWVATVPIQPERKTFTLLDVNFSFLADKSPPNRGKGQDKLNLADAASIQFGLSFDFSPNKPGDYTFHVDQAATFSVRLPAGFAMPLFERRLPVFDDFDIHYYRTASRLRTFAGQDILKTRYDRSVQLSGISAVGFPYVTQSAYIPLLELLDPFGRRVGFAGGALVHYAGDYAGGNWLIFGVEDDAFYEADEFSQTVLAAVNTLKDGTYAQRLKKADRLARETVCDRRKSHRPPVKLDAADGTLRSADGKPFFMLGVNYIGSFDVKCRHASEHFYLHKWETDFQKASRAGVNCFRLWIEGLDGRKERMDSILTLAEKYGIYLLLMPAAHPLEHSEDLARMFSELAAMVADEPIVIGFDLMNEPYVSTTASMRINGEPGPVSRHRPYKRYADKGLYDAEWVNASASQRTGWPPLGDWVGPEEAANLYAAYDILRKYANRYVPSQDYSSLYGLPDRLPEEPEIADLIECVNRNFEIWINGIIKAIRKHDSTHTITVGYNTLLTALPANEKLDFVSHHLYQPPVSYENMLKAVGAFERLRALWPDKPITLGEFGYSTGTKLLDGSLLDRHTAAMAEMVIYLYAYANGYGGAMSWMVTDWPVPLMDYNAPWIPNQRQRYESGFGMYCFDGSAVGTPKPIVPAMRFFADYLGAADKPGGQFRIVRASTPVGFGYTYKNDDALFVGMKEYADDQLTLRSDKTANLMMRWKHGTAEIMATADAQATLDRNTLQRHTGGRDFHIAGKCAAYHMTDDHLRFELLEGERVKLTAINIETHHYEEL